MKEHAMASGKRATGAKQIASALMRFDEVTEERPFGPDVTVYKVAGKVFAIVRPDAVPVTIALKCDPDLAIHLRERYPAIVPGYHLNKKHWNTVTADGSVPWTELESLIELSYDLVVAGHAKAIRERLTSGVARARRSAR